MGLVKLVFATETLSLGINMPARTVVIERLSKFTGEKHEMLTPIDYTQLTGRAGAAGWTSRLRRDAVQPVGAPGEDRRARDAAGVHAALVLPSVVQHGGQPRPELRPRDGGASAEFVVRAVRHPIATLCSGKANSDARNAKLEECDGAAACATPATSSSTGGCAKRPPRRWTTAAARRRCAMRSPARPGDVVWPERLGRAVILEQVRNGQGAPRVTVMTADRKLRRLGPRDFREPPEPVGQMTLRGQSWRSTKARKDIARELDRVSKGKRPERHQPARGTSKKLVERLRVPSGARLSGPRRPPQARGEDRRAGGRGRAAAPSGAASHRARSPGRSTACSPSCASSATSTAGPSPRRASSSGGSTTSRTSSSPRA